MKNNQNSTLADMKWPQERAATIPSTGGVFDAAFSKIFQISGWATRKHFRICMSRVSLSTKAKIKNNNEKKKSIVISKVDKKSTKTQRRKAILLISSKIAFLEVHS